MERISLQELHALDEAFDRAAQLRRDIDPFCSRTDWILPAHEALMPEARKVFAWRDDDGFIALCQGTHPQDGWRYLQPLEAMWCFASPLVGPNAERLAHMLLHACHEVETHWDVAMISGVAPRSELFAAVARSLGQRYRLAVGPTTRRYGCQLSPEVEPYLASRSRSLRKSIRRAETRADGLGLVFEDAAQNATTADADMLYDRILAVETKSWKGVEGVGINDGPMRDFYRAMVARLLRRNALHLWFARQEEQDIAYILGGQCGRHYRGLQFSFDDRFRAMGLGNLMQYMQIRELCRRGFAYYDLGSDIEYKRRWGDSSFDTVMLIATRH